MEPGTTTTLISTIFSILIVSLFIHFGAKSVTKDAGFTKALIVAVVGSLFAGIIYLYLGGTTGLILAVAAWGLVAAAIYRTTWVGGLMIGLVAWILWLVVSWIIRELL